MSTNTQGSCPDCGPTPVNHFSEVYGSVVVKFLRIPASPVMWVYRRMTPLISKLGTQYVSYFFLKTLEAIGVGQFTSDIHPTMSDRTKVIWEAAKPRGINMQGFIVNNRASDILVAKKDGKMIVFDALPRPRGKSSRSADWIDNKGLLRKNFIRAGIPVARGGMFFSTMRAVATFNNLDKPVIVKPSDGSRSRHTTININTEEELLKAIRVSKQLSPWIILEEQLVGFVYRATVIGGKVVGVMRREPPHVIGDGSSTVMQLVEEENKNPDRSGPIFHLLDTGAEAIAELVRQGLDFESIPAVGQLVTLNPKVGRSSGASNRDVTDITHPDNIALFQRVAEVLDESLVGIDFIIEDISKSWKEQKKLGVIECNSLPFIDLHHYPLYGKPRDAAGALWDIVFTNKL